MVQMHFPSRDFIQQEVFKFSEKQTVLRLSENRKFMMLWDFSEEMSHQISIVILVRFRPTQLCRDVITNSYCVNVMRRSYDISRPMKIDNLLVNKIREIH